MTKHFFVAVGVAALVVSSAAVAQGLPFSSTNNTNQRWNVNRAEPRDMNAFHAQADQQKLGGLGLALERITCTN